MTGFADRPAYGVWADKSAAAASLASAYGGRFCLFRPRGFGKTALIDMLESLFRHGLRDFAGLGAEATWRGACCDVLRLDFNRLAGVRSEAEFFAEVRSLFQKAMEAAGIRFALTSEDPLADFSRFLAGCAMASLVLLVDDCDAPLAGHLGDEPADRAIRSAFRTFCAKLKSLDGPLRFLLLTGEQKLELTDFNSLVDLSLMPDGDELTGFTTEDAAAAVEAALARGAAFHSRDEALALLTHQAGGFCFDGHGERCVFSPAAVRALLYGKAAPEVPALPDWARRAAAPGQWFVPMAALERSHEFGRGYEGAVWLYRAGLLAIAERDGSDVELAPPNEAARTALSHVAALSNSPQ